MAICLDQNQLSAGQTSPNVYIAGGASASTSVKPYVLTVGTTPSDTSTCALVAITGDELKALQSSASSSTDGTGSCTNPFALSAEDGGYLSAAIVGCWIAAYFVRSIINVVQTGVES